MAGSLEGRSNHLTIPRDWCDVTVFVVSGQWTVKTMLIKMCGDAFDEANAYREFHDYDSAHCPVASHSPRPRSIDAPGRGLCHFQLPVQIGGIAARVEVALSH